VIADHDKKSKQESNGSVNWYSTFKTGVLKRESSGQYSIFWNEEIELNTQINEAGRAMELSELVYFNDKLYTFSDRAGIAFEIEDRLAIPTYIVTDGNGKTGKGFKVEWATVKDSYLYIGSTGKEWTNAEGKIINHDPMWIKRVDSCNRIEHIDWSEHYTNLRRATGTLYPGYMLHEAVNWNPVYRSWVFLPRRVSTIPYDEKTDELMGSNVMIVVDEHFNHFNVTTIGKHRPTRGFSSLKFLPGREHEVVAIKSEEHNDQINSYIMVFDMFGNILLDETHIGSAKYEGIEIL